MRGCDYCKAPGHDEQVRQYQLVWSPHARLKDADLADHFFMENWELCPVCALKIKQLFIDAWQQAIAVAPPSIKVPHYFPGRPAPAPTPQPAVATAQPPAASPHG